MNIVLISEALNASLNAQISHELYNANLYLFIAGDLKNRGFDNLAAHFEKQRAEEIEHSTIIYKLLTDLNSPVKISEIDEVRVLITSIRDVAIAYLQREMLTTKSLDEIKHHAMDENNPVVEERLRQMITLQQNEYEEATSFADYAEICGDDWFKVLVWDSSLK